MTARPAPKGWCPGAYRPMASGDGLIVRVRPRLARLTARQALGLCAASAQFGSGIIDLTSRANMQLRGVKEDGHQPLLDALWSLDLLDADPDLEGRRNILVDPLWRDGDDTHRIAVELEARLANLPALPPKFGFAIDAGRAPVLRQAPADIRVERGSSGGLILRAEGVSQGRAIAGDMAVEAILAMARWFTATCGAVGRMVRHPDLASLPADLAPDEHAAPAADLPGPGDTSHGPALGVAFGQIDAPALARLMSDSGALALRLCPNRTLVLEGGRGTPAPGFLTDPDDPLRRVDACPGAPFCPQATVDTRTLARALAPLAPGSLHVSGCAKGCARAKPAAITLTGREGRFDLVRDGVAWDAPAATGLVPAALPAVLGAR